MENNSLQELQPRFQGLLISTSGNEIARTEAKIQQSALLQNCLRLCHLDDILFVVFPYDRLHAHDIKATSEQLAAFINPPLISGDECSEVTLR